MISFLMSSGMSGDRDFVRISRILSEFTAMLNLFLFTKLSMISLVLSLKNEFIRMWLSLYPSRDLYYYQ